MDAFKVHERLIDDYQSFTEGFVDIRDERLGDRFRQLSLEGQQWPDPWLSLNPSFEDGGRIDELIDVGAARFAMSSDLRDQARWPSGCSVLLYRHQREAIEVAAKRRSYVLTTGTGSRASHLSYIVPIVDRVLRGGTGQWHPRHCRVSDERAGQQPSGRTQQVPEGRVRRRRLYATADTRGRSKSEARREVLDNPPDVLLTNYVMLELMLTRPRSVGCFSSTPANLEFLVLDELHTYRGRQGADVAMLVRRIRDLTWSWRRSCSASERRRRCRAARRPCEQQRDVASVASRIFGTRQVTPGDVIIESLVQATAVRDPAAPDLEAAVASRGEVEHHTSLSIDELRTDPLASWIEDTFGIQPEPDSGRLVRRPPATVRGAGLTLAKLTGTARNSATNALRATLRAADRRPRTRETRPIVLCLPPPPIPFEVWQPSSSPPNHPRPVRSPLSTRWSWARHQDEKRALPARLLPRVRAGIPDGAQQSGPGRVAVPRSSAHETVRPHRGLPVHFD